MTDKKTMEKIQQSMNRSLSGMASDDLLAERVLRRAEKTQGEESVKKKISGSLILAIILMILAATVAVAVTNWDTLKQYFETVRVMETTGELARWSDEDKVKLLQAMADAGIVSAQDAHVQTAMDAALPLAERGPPPMLSSPRAMGRSTLTATPWNSWSFRSREEPGRTG